MADDQSSVAASASEAPDLRKKEYLDSIKAFFAEFSKESERAAVILIGARLDYLLGHLLSEFLLPNTGSGDELLGSERALGTFGSRIHAAYRLGLIDADFARALNIFRRLRNDFAHETAGRTLNEGPTRDRVRELVAPVARYQMFMKVRQTFFKDKSEMIADFFSVSALLVGRLENACRGVNRVTNTSAYTLVPRMWRTEKEADE
jgi:hypothetical protein